jgi:hypothetical protein
MLFIKTVSIQTQHSMFYKINYISDINECEHPDACGINAICLNSPGNYTCSCLEGFIGNPFDGVRTYFAFW